MSSISTCMQMQSCRHLSAVQGAIYSQSLFVSLFFLLDLFFALQNLNKSMTRNARHE
jgi:hypothetical protein